MLRSPAPSRPAPLRLIDTIKPDALGARERGNPRHREGKNGVPGWERRKLARTSVKKEQVLRSLSDVFFGHYLWERAAVAIYRLGRTWSCQWESARVSQRALRETYDEICTPTPLLNGRTSALR